MKIRDKNLSEITGELKNILVLAKKYWASVVVFTAMALFSTVFGILASLVSQSLIDIVTGSPTSDSILNFNSIYGVVGAAIAFSAFYAQLLVLCQFRTLLY